MDVYRFQIVFSKSDDLNLVFVGKTLFNVSHLIESLKSEILHDEDFSITSVIYEPIKNDSDESKKES